MRGKDYNYFRNSIFLAFVYIIYVQLKVPFSLAEKRRKMKTLS